ncbi:D-alanine--D-alanine ligase [compost metagenome]
MDNMKIKIGVFFGGKSVEHEVSIISAIQAINYIDKEKYDVIPVYITRENDLYIGQDIDKIEEYKNIENLLRKSKKVILFSNNSKVQLIEMRRIGNKVCSELDIAFPIVHGTNVEDGALQGYFKTLNLPFVGCDVTASALGMDKYAMKTVLKDNNIPVLECKCFTFKQYNEDEEEVIKVIEEKFNYPVIVKPINLGSSVGIKIGKNKEELIEALEYAFQYAKKILVEEAITNLKEINCSVLGDYEEAIASELEEPINTDEILSYKDKYIGGEKSGASKGMQTLKRKLPAEISDETKREIQEMAVSTFKILGCNGISRIDFMIDQNKNKVYVNEINTIPRIISILFMECIRNKIYGIIR